MHLESFTYDLATRSWSVPALPHLDAAGTLVLAFGSPEMVAHPRVFQLLRDAYPSSSLIGCSSAGVIAGAEVRDRALSVVVAKFERTKLRMAATLVGTGRLRAAGEGLARKLLGPRLRALLVLAEGLRIDGDALVTGIRSVVGEEVVVAGGLAGDDVRFERTWVCSGNHLQSGLIAAVGFYGDELIVGCGSESGWDRFGPERQVTRAEGNTLYELDGAPAAEVYKRYLGPRMAGLPAAGMLYPLALWPAEARRASGADAFAVRPLLAADEETGALVFAGSVPEGHHAQLMRTDADRLLHSAVDAALAASRAANLAGDAGARREPGPDAPAVLGIAIGGLGRRLALGERADEELKAARRALPPGAVTAGFYGYGEIAPDGEGRCRLQHQSMTVLLLGEPGRPATKEISAGVPVRTASTADSGPQTLSQISLSARPSEDDNTVTGVSALGDDDVAPTSGFAEVTSFMRDLDTGTWSVSPLPALDSPRTLVLVFASSEAHAHPRAFADLRLAYPKSHIIGCSTAGEILGLEARSRSMVVAVMRFAHTELASAQVALGTSRDGAAAGSAVGRELAGEKLRGLLVFSSAPAIAGEALLAGLRAEVGPDVAIAGGVAAGGARGEYSWVLARGTLARQAVAAVGLYGDHVILGHGARVGWSDLGPARSVTRSQGGVLLQLDGRPALHFYREALGASKGVPGPIPVALTGAGAGEGGTRRWRVVVAMDDRQHALTLAGGIPPASQVQLVRTSVDQLLGSASEAAQAASKAAGRTGPNALGLMLGNTVRHTALGERAASEIEAVAGALGGVRLVGCYARGAISSLEDDESALAVTVLGESPAARGTKSTAELTAEALAAAAAAADAPWLDAAATAEPTRTVAGLKQAAEQARTGSGTSAGRPLPPRPPPRPAQKTASPAPPTASVPVPVPPEASGASRAPENGGDEDDEPTASFAIASFTYDAEERRWSVPAFPELDSPRTMVLAFGAPELASTPEVFTELRQAYPRAHVLGCSTAGEIAAGEVRDRSLAVAVVRFARTTLTTASVVVGDAAGSFPAGQVLAHKLNEPGLRAIVLLAEGLEIGGSELLRGIKSVIDDSVVITGGLAGDGLRFQRTWVLSGDAVQGSLVTAVGLYGDYVCVGQGAEGGWHPHGPPGTVTRSSGNVLHEIDGRPALAWYKEHLGPHAAGLPATGLLFPLGIELGDGEDAFLARTAMAIDEGQESMTLAGDAPQGRGVRVLAATSSQLADGAREAAEIAGDELESVGENALVLLVSAVGRRVVLGDGASAELAAARAVLPEGVTTAGFYGYGGFASYRGRATELHNQTFLATVLAESEEPLTRPTAAAISASEPLPRNLASASAATPMQTHRAGHAARRAAQQQPELTHRDAGGVRIIELGGRLDESFDGRAVAALITGITVIDLAHIERVSSYGVREWLQMMEEADTEALYLARCAEPLVNQLMLIRAMLGHAVVISFAAPYVCKVCEHAFVHMLDCERDAAAIAENRPPDVPCARCGRAARFDDDPEAYRAFFEPHLGQPIPAAVRQALAHEETTGARAAEVISAMALAQGRAGLPALHGALLGVLVTALVLAGVYWFALRPQATGGGAIDPAVASTQDAGAVAAAQHLEVLPGDVPARPEQPPRAVTEVPAWVDRGIDIQDREVLVVGRSGTHADLHGAMPAAYRDAVRELLEHVQERLQGSPVYGYLRNHVDPALAADAPAGALERVLARYEAQVGASALPERVASFPIEREGSASVTAWYRLPRDEFERVLARYQATVRALDMTVVTMFPLLAASQTGQGDVLVLEVAPGSAAQRAGVVPGDVIVRVGDRDVSSPEEYAAAAKTAWENTRSRRSLELVLFSGGQRVVRTLKKR